MLQDAQAEPPAVRITAEDLLAQLFIPGDVAGSGALTAGPRCFSWRRRGPAPVPLSAGAPGSRTAQRSHRPARRQISYGPSSRARRAKATIWSVLQVETPGR
jgi:hypothetical protein